MRKGFTMIELLVVIAILGILAAIGLPRFNEVRERAKVDAARQTLESIRKVLDMYAVLQDNQQMFPQADDFAGMLQVIGSHLNADVFGSIRNDNPKYWSNGTGYTISVSPKTRREMYLWAVSNDRSVRVSDTEPF